MELNRRSFLRSLGLAAAGMTLDPELALWVPGRKTYFEMPRRVRPRGNQFITVEQLSEEFLAMMKVKLKAIGPYTRYQ